MTDLAKQYTLSELEAMVDKIDKGRGQLNVEIPGLSQKDKIYGTPEIALYWLKKRAGLIEYGARGPDVNVRTNYSQKTVAARYKLKTGRTIEDDMNQELEMVQMMFEAASIMEKPNERFAALKDCQKAQNSYNKTWAPFLEHKLGILQTKETVEDRLTIDDVLDD